MFESSIPGRDDSCPSWTNRGSLPPPAEGLPLLSDEQALAA